MKKIFPYVLVLVLLSSVGYCLYTKPKTLPIVEKTIVVDNDSLNKVIAEQKSQILNLSKMTQSDSITISNLTAKLKQLGLKPKNLDSKIDFVLLTSDSGITHIDEHTNFILLDSGQLDSSITQTFSDTSKHLIINGVIENKLLNYKYAYKANYEILLQKKRKNVFTPYEYKALLLSDDDNASATISSVKFLNESKIKVGAVATVNTFNLRPQIGVFGEYVRSGFVFELSNTYFLQSGKIKPVFGINVRKPLVEF